MAFACFAAATLHAQHPAGLLTGMPPAGVSLSTLSTSVGGEFMLRVSADAYRGIGAYAVPGSHRVLGAVIHVADLTPGDGEEFDVHAYLEAGTSNLPTIRGPEAPGTSAVASVLGLTTPAGQAEHQVTVRFPDPVDVPIGKDLFVSVVLRTPGLRLRSVGGSRVPGFTQPFVDSCGAGLDLDESFAVLHQGSGLVPMGNSFFGWQPMIDLLVDGSSGVAVSARGPGLSPTASMYSGLHPDSALPSNQPGRADLPGYVFRANGTVGQGAPVFLLGSAQPFAGPPWIVLSPGAAVLHLSPVGLVGLGSAVVAADGTATMFWPVPRSSAVRGVDVRSQAFAFDTATGAVAAGAAVRQRF